jgi:hypothetical protein
VSSSVPGILDAYVKSAPSARNAVEIFKGEWSSILPRPYSELTGGFAALFDDDRVRWFIDTIGGVGGKRVLELGPLEGGHSYMLDQAGAAEVTAIESNTRAFLKCLIAKEILDLGRVRFHCGDFLTWLRNSGPKFEVGLASGVLYHMENPVELIELVARRVAGPVLWWTHYHDASIIGANPALAPKFTGSTPAEYGGFRHVLHRQEYQKALGWAGFCGGAAPFSAWLSRDDLMGAFKHFGLAVVAIGFEQREHPHGPSLAVVTRPA